MKNSSINFITNVLSPIQLDIQKSSARRRFLRHIKGYKEDYDLESEEIKKEFCDKNPKGEPLVINNIIQYSKDNKKKASAKFEILNNLVINIDWTGKIEDKKTMIGVLQDKIVELENSGKVAPTEENPNPEAKYSDAVFGFIENIQEIITELQTDESGNTAK